MKALVTALAISSAVIGAPSFAQSQSASATMQGMAMPQQTQQTTARGVGIVKAIDTVHGTITLQHQPIAALKWPAMTMAFKAASPDLLKAIKVGDRVQFTLRKSDPILMLTTIQKAKP
jgi:Cu(I)/Ag(I) efflux system protein CusF